MNVRNEWDGVEQTAKTLKTMQLACGSAPLKIPLFYQLLSFSRFVFARVFLRVHRGIDATPDLLGCGSFRSAWGGFRLGKGEKCWLAHGVLLAGIWGSH